LLFAVIYSVFDVFSVFWAPTDQKQSSDQNQSTVEFEPTQGDPIGLAGQRRNYFGQGVNEKTSRQLLI